MSPPKCMTGVFDDLLSFGKKRVRGSQTTQSSLLVSRRISIQELLSAQRIWRQTNCSSKIMKKMSYVQLLLVYWLQARGYSATQRFKAFISATNLPENPFCGHLQSFCRAHFQTGDAQETFTNSQVWRARWKPDYQLELAHVLMQGYGPCLLQKGHVQFMASLTDASLHLREFFPAA